MTAISINGGLRAKKGSIVLTIYSTPLARFLLDNQITYLNAGYNSKEIILRKGSQRSVTIERKKEGRPLATLRVTKLLPKEFVSRLKKERKQKSIKVIIENIAREKVLHEYNLAIKYKKFDDVDCFIPDHEKIKVGCHVSVFRNKSGFNYRFCIRHRILEEIARREESVLLGRTEKGEFVLRRDKRGTNFNLFINKKGHPLVYMQLSPDFITEEEHNLFKSGRRCFSSKALFSRKEFDLDVSKFFMTKDERELARALLTKGVNIRIPEMRKREADIVLNESGAQIEITRVKPRLGENTKNSPHSEGVHINARLCEGFLRVSKGVTPFYIVVFDKQWEGYGWVKELMESVKPKVYCYTTDFEQDWENTIAKKIKTVLCKENDRVQAETG
ncbi:hypothetical protein KY329_02630 [Candidatus Woesearchaeota archaeon]|nr:hypothetical protein [Candidatus Woesearchaeota archaeon]